MEYIIHEDNPQYSFWLKIYPLFLLPYFAFGIFGMSIIGIKSIQTITYIPMLLAPPVFIALLIWSRLHRKYLIFDDRLKIVRGWPFSTTVQFKSIKTASEATGKDFTASYDRFLSDKNGVLITRDLELSIIIAPSNREQFLMHFNEALNEWKRKKESSIKAGGGK
jgi:hypothetical protein